MTEAPQCDGSRPLTPTDVCAQCADDPPATGKYYCPSPKQTPFFTLTWAAKQGARVDQREAFMADEDGELLSAGEVQARLEKVRVNLGCDGRIFDGLQHRSAKEWELLRLQLEKPLRGYNCRMADKQDALGDAVYRVLRLLGRTPASETIEMWPDAITGTAATGADLARLYDFTSPFYGYAGRIARNALITILRKKQAPDDIDDERDSDVQSDRAGRQELGYEIDWDYVIDNVHNDYATAEGDEVPSPEFIAVRVKLKRLLDEIDKLPTRQRQVMQLTLAARPQFYEALEFLQLPFPTAIAKHVALTPDAQTDQVTSQPNADACLAALCDDDAIGLRLERTVNVVRVTRHNAVRRICDIDQDLCGLLNRLIEPDRTKRAESAPAPVNEGEREA
jgi:hypothetical protein